jgi:hypothetical protein
MDFSPAITEGEFLQRILPYMRSQCSIEER